VKVAFDYQIFMNQSFGGISRYITRLAQGLNLLGDDARIVAPLHRNRYLTGESGGIVSGREFKNYPPKSSRMISIANRVLSKREMMRFQPDIIHETYYSKRPVAVQGAARIITVHDMIHEKFSSCFSRRDSTSANKRTSVSRADHILAVSQSTKNDLCELLNVPSDKVSVVHLGFNVFPMPCSNVTTAHDKRPFLLYVGNRGGYKNFEGLLKAVASNFSLYTDFDIVAFGGGLFNDREAELISSLGFRSGAVQQIGGDDEVLGALYRTASAFIFPSLYEGFGLPPLEAMAHDCPVVTSNTSSMPEVVGNAGEYFDPADIDAQADAIGRVVFDQDRRAELIAEGRDRLNHFSWERCAFETRNVYQQVCEG